MDVPGKVLARVRGLVDRQPVWNAPFAWADEDGLWASDDAAWLYRQLPEVNLRDPAALTATLTALARVLPGRAVHLLVHRWVGAPELTGPPALAGWQGAALAFPPAKVALSIGVELTPSAMVRSVGQEITDAVDDLLGELVVDLSRFTADRAHVSDALTRVGATPAGAEVTALISQWHTFGRDVDVEVVERDGFIQVPDGSRMEFVTAASVAHDGRAGGLPDAAEQSVNVTSVRGVLTLTDVGRLMRASVIYARRAVTPRAPLTATVQELPAVTVRPLPLRQLAALHETLPCSPKRLEPTHQRLDGAALAALGVSDPNNPGAPAGVLLGRGGATLVRPVLADLTAGNKVTVIAGQARSGRSTLAQQIAIQCALAGRRVMYLATSSPSVLSSQVPVAVWRPSDPGELDPSRWVDRQAALRLYFDVITAVPAGLTDADVEALTRGFSRSGALADLSLPLLLQLADSATSAARIGRAMRANPTWQVFAAPTPADRRQLPQTVWVDLSVIDQPLRSLAVAILIEHAAATGAVVVADDVAHDHAPLARALRDLCDASVVLVGELHTLPAAAKDAANRVALATTDPGTITWVGREPTPAMHAWIAAAAPARFAGDRMGPPSGVVWLHDARSWAFQAPLASPGAGAGRP